MSNCFGVRNEKDFAFEPGLAYCDLGIEHSLCNFQNSEVVGIIDWERAAVEDPAIDFADVDFSLGRNFMWKQMGS